MVRLHTSYIIMAFTLLLLAPGRIVTAQTWTHGTSVVDVVTNLSGNYVYAAGGSGGTVEALFPPTGVDLSRCAVVFKVQWSISGPPPWTGGVTYAADMTGSTTGGATAYVMGSTDDGGGGNPFYTTTGGAFYHYNVYIAYMDHPSNSFWVHIAGDAKVTRGTGTAGDAFANLFTSM